MIHETSVKVSNVTPSITLYHLHYPSVSTTKSFHPHLGSPTCNKWADFVWCHLAGTSVVRTVPPPADRCSLVGFKLHRPWNSPTHWFQCVWTHPDISVKYGQYINDTWFPHAKIWNTKNSLVDSPHRNIMVNWINIHWGGKYAWKHNTCENTTQLSFPYNWHLCKSWLGTKTMAGTLPTAGNHGLCCYDPSCTSQSKRLQMAWHSCCVQDFGCRSFYLVVSSSEIPYQSPDL